MREERRGLNVNLELNDEEFDIILRLIGDRCLAIEAIARRGRLSPVEIDEIGLLSNLDMQMRSLGAQNPAFALAFGRLKPESEQEGTIEIINTFVGFEAAAQMRAKSQTKPVENSSRAADRRDERTMRGTIPAPIANDPVEW